MCKFLKFLRKVAEAEGLIFAGTESRNHHAVAYFDNDKGARLTRTFHVGSPESGRDVNNSRAELRRFARGQYHGLKVTQGASQ